MNRIIARIFAILVATALFAGLVYFVLRVAQVSDPAATTVHGPTARRLWATGSALLALAGSVAGGLAFTRRGGRFGGKTTLGAVVAGAIAAVNGGLVLGFADGGPGSGNGVVGGAAALVLGLIAMALGGLAMARARDVANHA